ncbi:hypothetical protein L288_02630 [Sphingobium quisquiliarum P25]|uniref:Uncharacterized protein n=1 Tax=Sphingobium quisquiliarum P25 TaxID=1329909 RepID=T0H7I3_9SPHN|nr:hypothetical protein L288_02630 [Sphingobium quisquiliarum P25]
MDDAAGIVVVDAVAVTAGPLASTAVPLPDDSGVEPLLSKVAAPAAATHSNDNPAPAMEPVSLIFMMCNPRFITS